jgi:predicted phosphodiesterase
LRYAFLSDIHGHVDVLRYALAQLRKDAIDRIVTLGDIGSNACFETVRASGAIGVFGNWEVSGYSRLSPENRAFVLQQRPVLTEDGFLAAHAAPTYPAGLFNVSDFAAYLRRTKAVWSSVFRYLRDDDDDLWQTFAEMQARGKSLFFHGHTHKQRVWRIGPLDRPREIHQPVIVLEASTSYVVGVGSLGQPEDGPSPRYVIYDSVRNEIELRALTRPGS